MTEFGLIESIKALFSTLPTNSFEGIGDDCAVLPIGKESLLFTADMLVEDIHFKRELISPFDLGRKSLAVNLSDVASMGATPVATLLSLSLPKGGDPAWVEAFMEGYYSLSREYDVALIGGDTTSSTSQITINVTAIGRAPSQNIKRRADAQPTDAIFVTGHLGGSAAGLRDLLKGDVATSAAKIHCCPRARIEEGAWLGEQSCVRAMMDISDGVASDLCHIMKSSGVGAVVELSKLPTSYDYHTALCGGEDYELLFTVERAAVDEFRVAFEQKFKTPLSQIGEIVDGGDVEWQLNGERYIEELMGFRHF